MVSSLALDLHAKYKTTMAGGAPLQEAGGRPELCIGPVDLHEQERLPQGGAQTSANREQQLISQTSQEF